MGVMGKKRSAMPASASAAAALPAAFQNIVASITDVNTNGSSAEYIISGSGNEFEWKVSRTYTAFREARDAMIKTTNYANVAALPGKHFMSSSTDAKVVAERRVGLQRFTSQTVGWAKTSPIVQEFLGVVGAIDSYHAAAQQPPPQYAPTNHSVAPSAPPPMNPALMKDLSSVAVGHGGGGFMPPPPSQMGAPAPPPPPPPPPRAPPPAVYQPQTQVYQPPASVSSIIRAGYQAGLSQQTQAGHPAQTQAGYPAQTQVTYQPQ